MRSTFAMCFYISIIMIKYIDRSLNLPNKSESVSTLRYNPSARMDRNSRRIPFSLHFGQLRASNYRGTSRGFRAEAGSLFSRTCETRFRYRRRVLFILRSATTARKRCHTSLPVSLWFADSRILPREREFRRTRSRFGSPAFQFRRTFTGID